MKDNRDIELQEARLLIDKGYNFSVIYTRLRCLGLCGCKTIEKEFCIQEPTLATLDRMSEVWVQMDIDENMLAADTLDVVVEAKKLVAKNTRKIAKVVAIAVLGEKHNEKDCKRLTSIFFKSLRPSQLVEISSVITSVSNLGDFINSMRSMSGARTTRKIANDIE